MKNFFALIIILAILSSCAPTQEQIEKAIQETQTAEVRLYTSTPTDANTPLPTDSNTPLPTDTPAATNTPTYTVEGFKCGKYFTIAVLEPPIFASVLEDNPPYYPFYGIFMIVKIRLVNHTDSPIWVWYSNYYMKGLLNGEPVLYQLSGVDDPSHALEKLYKTNPFQAEIGPITTYDTMVAFDVNPEGENWNLVVMPDQLCSVTIPLENN